MVGCKVLETCCLISSGRCDGSSTALFARGAGGRCRLDIKSDVLIALLENEDGSCEVSSLVCLRWGEFFDRGINKEDIGQVIELFSFYVWLLVDIPMKTEIPAAFGPVAIPTDQSNVSTGRPNSPGHSRNIENLRGQCSDLIIVDAQ